jgi:hypothetical protein
MRCHGSPSLAYIERCFVEEGGIALDVAPLDQVLQHFLHCEPQTAWLKQFRLR